MKILIVRLSAIGDVVHCLPLAAQIKARLPQANITWLVEPPARALLENNPAIDQVVVFEKKDLTSRLKDPLQLGTVISKFKTLLTTLSANHFDLAIDAQGLLKSALLARASGAPVRVGFKGAREGADFFMTDTLDVGDYYNLTTHVVDHNIALANFAVDLLARRKNLVPEASPGTITFPLPIPKSSVQQEIKTLLSGHGVTGGGGSDDSRAQSNDAAPPPGSIPGAQPLPLRLNCPIAVLIPGTTWQTKIWPAQHWIDLGVGLIGAGVGRLIICGGIADEGTNQSIYKGIESRLGKNRHLIDLTGKTDLIQLIAVFQSANLVVAADSGPMHLAVASAGPWVVAIHGSTPWLRNGPYGPRGRAVYAGIVCQPCFSKTCALTTIECLRDLPASKVLQAIVETLD